jgi:hypothetical protein
VGAGDVGGAELGGEVSVADDAAGAVGTAASGIVELVVAGLAGVL